MNLVYGFFFLILGAFVGSFLNVVIIRYNTSRGISGRSGCLSCGHELAAAELIPILSFLILRGRCRHCRSRISLQYPLVELTAALVAFLTALKFDFNLSTPAFWLSLFSWFILIVIAVYDIRHKIIPDALVFTFISLSFLSSMIRVAAGAGLALEISTGPIFFLPFLLIWLLSRGTAIGLGDAKLAAGIGWMLGLPAAAAAIVLGFWIGAIISLAAMGFSRAGKRGVLLQPGRQFTMKSEIPFAPFLIAGAAIVFFTGIDFVGLADLFSFINT